MAKAPSARFRIIDAATRLMWRDGYDAVSIDSICAAAGVLKGSFYHAFASKEELLTTLISAIWNNDRGQIEAIHERAADPIEKLRGHLTWFGDAQEKLAASHGFVPGYFNMAVGINAPSSAKVLIANHHREHGGMIRVAIHDALPCRAANEAELDWKCKVVTHLIAGAAIEARLTNSLAPFDHLPETALAVLGLGEPPIC